MMARYSVPDISWKSLISADMDHPAYTIPTLKRAITLGIDPANKPLEYPMPRWQMADPDLDDLVAFIQTLK